MTDTTISFTAPASSPEVGVIPVSPDRVTTDGKFFRLGEKKFYPKGVTYGPFQDSVDAPHFPARDRVRADFELIRGMHANCLRVYYVPPPWFLDLAQECGLKILVEYPWAKHTCFLDDRATREEARRATRATAEALAGHPAVFAITLVNEIPPDIARWYGHQRIEEFIEELALIVKEVDPHRLVTFANFPSTEFLRPDGLDFVSFNVYLHDSQPFANYLDRLQSIAEGKPLVLTEFGLDSIREGEDHKSHVLSAHIETAFRAGVAGMFIFAFTDDWYTGGHQIENWAFGLTDRARTPREAYHAVSRQYERAPYFPLSATPKVSVVVASYNGARTLVDCLRSLIHLNYPDYEVILVDDGSTDETPAIAQDFPSVRTIHQRNLGLSAARNTGISASTGSVIAFTDSDCRADEDWLYYLILDLLRAKSASIGGHNFAPHEDNNIAACVAVSPGAPAHVLLDDRRAEHIPGCNMAFWRWALDEISGFDSQFRAAGDDVDVCWRLIEHGHDIAFSHSGFVWHYRRNTVKMYLKQQRGYGVAEGMLRHKHPDYFNELGGMRWHGRIYTASRMTDLFGHSIVYHGIFGSALFQTLYTPEPSGLLDLVTSLEWHVVVTCGGIVAALLWPVLWPLPALTLLASVALPVLKAAKVPLPPRRRRLWSRPLVAALHLLQPLVRGWPRYALRLTRHAAPRVSQTYVERFARPYPRYRPTYAVAYWNETGDDRHSFLRTLVGFLEDHRWENMTDSGWDEHDVTIYGDRFSQVLVTTVSEYHGGNKILLRARLTPKLTLSSRILICLLAIIVSFCFAQSARLAVTALLAILLAILCGLYLHSRKCRTLRLAAGMLDLVAKDRNWIKLAPKENKPADPPPAGDSSERKSGSCANTGV